MKHVHAVPTVPRLLTVQTQWEQRLVIILNFSFQIASLGERFAGRAAE